MLSEDREPVEELAAPAPRVEPGFGSERAPTTVESGARFAQAKVGARARAHAMTAKDDEQRPEPTLTPEFRTT